MAKHWLLFGMVLIGLNVNGLNVNGGFLSPSPCYGGSGVEKQDSKTVHREVDLIELNHFIDEDGREVFRQTIFYDWSPQAKQFHVRQWRLVADDTQLPVARWRPKGYECSWIDGNIRRHVRASQMRETWTQEDPERENRKILPEEHRRPLFENRRLETAARPLDRR